MTTIHLYMSGGAVLLLTIIVLFAIYRLDRRRKEKISELHEDFMKTAQQLEACDRLIDAIEAEALQHMSSDNFAALTYERIAGFEIHLRRLRG